ncbi:MAG: family 10 glycosylhydrolase [Bacteroidota bacterium]
MGVLTRLFLLASLCFLLSSSVPESPFSAVKREFRAVWVATFHNIDWPSGKGLSANQQKREYEDLLRRQQRNGMNAVIVQVRPSGDAFYESKFAPWSEYLTGTQGESPYPYYDPLGFMVKATHDKNMEFHAWFNPFRAVSHVRFSSVAYNNISKQQPNWVFQYGDRIYLNPGLPAVRKYLVATVMELVNNYDIDGLHFDDYFYPYTKDGIPLPDRPTFRRYGQGFSNIDDWRRNNIDSFIKELSDSLKIVAPHVKFGISPVGIWRNKSKDQRGSNTRVSHTSYDMLYADVRKWLELGWIDYVAPQLYWSTRHPSANYEALLPWWANNSFGRHCYIGHAMFKVKKDNSRHWDNPTQLPLQLDMKKKHRASIQGSVFYSANSFEGNPHRMEDALKNKYHKFPALIPSMPWKDNIAPLAPEQLQVYRDQEKVHLHWNMPKRASDGDLPRYFVVYRYLASERIDLENPQKIIHISRETTFTDLTTDHKQNYTYAVTSVDRLHNESKTLAAAMLRRTGYTRPGVEGDTLRTDNKVYPRYWDNRGQNLRRNTNTKSRFKKSGN